MEYLMEMSQAELFVELLVCSKICDERIEELKNVDTPEAYELAEERYYLAQEQWTIVMNEVKRRNKVSEFLEFRDFVYSKGWL